MLRPLLDVSGMQHPSISGLVRVANTELFNAVFQILEYRHTSVLYEYACVRPFSYLNQGRFKLYINADWNDEKIIPVLQKFNDYNIWAPYAKIKDILKVVGELQLHSESKVSIVDLTQEFVDEFLSEVPRGWYKHQSGDDIIHRSSTVVELATADKKLRHTLRRAERTPIEVFPLNSNTRYCAQQVIRDWQLNQGRKYFRSAVGRDFNLINLYYDKVDGHNLLSYVYFVADYPMGFTFACRSRKTFINQNESDWGIFVVGKARLDCAGLGDWIFHHTVSEMYKQGMNYVNDGGCITKGQRDYKSKWHPETTIKMFELRQDD